MEQKKPHKLSYFSKTWKFELKIHVHVFHCANSLWFSIRVKRTKWRLSLANVYRNGCFLNFWPKCRLIRLAGSLCITKGIEPATKGTLFPPPLWFAGKWTKRIKQNISSYLMAQKFELQLIFTIDEHTLSKKSNVMR